MSWNRAAASLGWGVLLLATAAASSGPAPVRFAFALPATGPSAQDEAFSAGPVELGLRFRSRTDGEVSALRYFRTDSPGIVERLSLWGDDGRLLARADAPTPAAGTWGEAVLPLAVPVTAGRGYTVSYTLLSGAYAMTPGGLDGHDISPTSDVRLENSVMSREGGSLALPASASTDNFWVDVAFTPSFHAATGSSRGPVPSDPSDGGYPGPDTAGVPADVSTSPYNGPCTITTPGTVISARTVECDLRIQAKNVVIENSLILGNIYADADVGTGSFTLRRSTVKVGARPGTAIGDAHFAALGVEVTGGSRSINCYRDCVVQDSWIHDQFDDPEGTYHESGIRFNTRSVLLHNTVACDAVDVPPDAGCSAAVTGYGEFDPVTDVVVKDNLFVAGSGGYCAYGGSSQDKRYSGSTRDVAFVGNVWQGDADSGGGCGTFGEVTDFDAEAPGAVWRDNRDDAGRAVLP